MVRVGWFAGDYAMNQRLRPLSCLLTLATLAVFSTDAAARASHKPQHAKKSHAKSHETAGGRHHRNAALRKTGHAKRVAAAQRKSTRSGDAPPPSAAAPPLSGDLAAVKEAIALARKAKTSEATALKNTIGDPAVQKLVEWFILRHSPNDAG
jgi:soluble lytic murein transglycosylase